MSDVTKVDTWEDLLNKLTDPSILGKKGTSIETLLLKCQPPGKWLTEVLPHLCGKAAYDIAVREYVVPENASSTYKSIRILKNQATYLQKYADALGALENPREALYVLRGNTYTAQSRIELSREDMHYIQDAYKTRYKNHFTPDDLKEAARHMFAQYDSALKDFFQEITGLNPCLLDELAQKISEDSGNVFALDFQNALHLYVILEELLLAYKDRPTALGKHSPEIARILSVRLKNSSSDFPLADYATLCEPERLNEMSFKTASSLTGKGYWHYRHYSFSLGTVEQISQAIAAYAPASDDVPTGIDPTGVDEFFNSMNEDENIFDGGELTSRQNGVKIEEFINAVSAELEKRSLASKTSSSAGCQSMKENLNIDADVLTPPKFYTIPEEKSDVTRLRLAYAAMPKWKMFGS
ncbi:MAG: hypothetical protein ABW189_05395 [Rickettsiales bacterium]